MVSKKPVWPVLLVLVGILALWNGGKYLGMAVLTFLTPTYALFLASILFIIFLITATIAVSVARKLEKRAAAREASTRKKSPQPRAA